MDRDTKNLLPVLTNKKGRIGSYYQFLTTDYYPHQKHWKLALDIVFFQTTYEDKCDYNPWCFIFGVLMLDGIIMNLFLDTTKKWSQWKRIFIWIRYDKIYLYQVYIQDYLWKKIIDYTKTYYVHIISSKSKIMEISEWFVIYNFWRRRSQKQNK